jgi:hypothetical protein
MDFEVVGGGGAKDMVESEGTGRGEGGERPGPRARFREEGDTTLLARRPRFRAEKFKWAHLGQVYSVFCEC